MNLLTFFIISRGRKKSSKIQGVDDDFVKLVSRLAGSRYNPLRSGLMKGRSFRFYATPLSSFTDDMGRLWTTET